MTPEPPANAGNAGVFAYLAPQGRSATPAFAAWDSIAMPYLNAGCHPDIVERLWDQIGKTLAIDCRCLIHGVPGLVDPRSGLILALGMGTQYAVRIPDTLIPQALASGAKTTTTWSGGRQTNIAEIFGKNWVFGHWDKIEIEACRHWLEQPQDKPSP